jgi:ureidoacrylate peracid hydrolase
MTTKYGYEPLSRDDALDDVSTTAVLFVDAQKYCCERTSPQYRSVERAGFDDEYFFDRLETLCKPNWELLVKECRKADVDIVTTVISSMRPDGKDLSRDYTCSGFRVYAPDPREELVSELSPATANEICLPKTSSSVFQSTNIDYILRNLGTKSIIVCGVLTDQCVDHAVRDACDLGYGVTLVEDACAAFTKARHETAIQTLQGYVDRIMSTDAICQELQKVDEPTVQDESKQPTP